jgi:hypothetical protein
MLRFGCLPAIELAKTSSTKNLAALERWRMLATADNRIAPELTCYCDPKTNPKATLTFEGARNTHGLLFGFEHPSFKKPSGFGWSNAGASVSRQTGAIQDRRRLN